MSPTTTPPWSRWTLVHAGVVTLGLTLVPFLRSVVPLLLLGGASLVVFAVRHGRASWANALTLARLGLLGLAAGVADLARLVTLVAVWALDGLDGALARKRNEVTDFGAQLDMETDALFVATLGGLLVVEGVVGPWAIGFGLIRTLFVLARAARPDAPRTERRSRLGRWIFSVTVVALLAALAIGPGFVSLAVGIGAAGALTVSFAPDYLALFGTKEAP